MTQLTEALSRPSPVGPGRARGLGLVRSLRAAASEVARTPPRLAAVAVAGAGIALLPGCQDPSSPLNEPFAIVGATVIDGTGAGPKEGWTILVEEGTITWLGPDGDVTLDPDVTSMDAAGKWVIPGLVDTHTHLPGPADQGRFFNTLLSFGVTTARSPAAAPETGIEARARLESGALTGPRFLTAGRLIDGPETIWQGFASIVRSEAETRAEVSRQAAAGVDFIKLYVGLTPDLVQAGVEAAHERGLRVVGHLGRTTWAEAVAAGVDALTHSCIWGMAHSLVPQADSARFTDFFQPNAGFDPSQFAAWTEAISVTDPRFVRFAEAAAQNGVAIDPNLVLCEAVVFGEDRSVLERLRPELDVQAAPFPHPYSRGWSPGERSAAEAAFPVFLEIIAELHRRGVRITLGTDTMNPWMTPGAAAHRELELLAAAGIRALDVLTIATRNGAAALGVLEATGTLEEGKDADLILLSADPLSDVSNVRAMELVLRGGVRIAPDPTTGRVGG